MGPLIASALALLAGVAHALSFAPEPSAREQCASLVLLLLIWLLQKPAGARWDLLTGFSFGLGWFTAGVGWTYVSMHDYGGMPAPIAGAAVLLFAAYLALFPAVNLWVTGAALRRLRGPAAAPGAAATTNISPSLAALITDGPGPGRAAFAVVAVLTGTWVVTEWLRGLLFTGFPWLGVGYAHIDGALAQYAPVLGVLGVHAAAVAIATAGATAVVLSASILRRPHRYHALLPAAVLVAGGCLLVEGGRQLEDHDWSEPQGPALRVRLLQGNVPQEMKFDRDTTLKSMRDYAALSHEASHLGALDLVVFPETAWTVPWSMTPPSIVAELFPATSHRAETGGPTRHLAIGMPLPALPGSRAPKAADGTAERHPLANAVLVLAGPDARPVAQYDKSHLVPFGEFVPWGFRWFVDLMQIPLGDFGRGAVDQAPVPLGGQKIAFNICYEDLFGAERLPAVRAGASVLINVSNIGWFGDSTALPQHLAISRMRALETARPMLRATNTGVTASIDARGRVRASAAPFTRAFIDDEVQGMSGDTPYVHFGDPAPLTLAAALILLGAIGLRRRGSGGHIGRRAH